MYFKCGVPFDICDKVALKHGYDHTDTNRIIAFLVYMYKESNHEGKLYLSQNNISDFSSQCVQLSVKLLLKYLVQIDLDGKMYYTLPEIYKKEKQIEKICNELRKHDHKISYAEEFENYMTYTTEDIDIYQYDTLQCAIGNNISIITGRPGTGKTYTIAQICSIVTQKKVLVYILAPTGAAVERIKSSTYIQQLSGQNFHIKTIHSFINLNNLPVGTYGCDKCKGYGDPNRPLCECVDQPISLSKQGYEEIIFFIDEMSMVGLNLFHRFMSIIKNFVNRSRLILLGDPNQLPSIDGGNILKDMMTCSKIKCMELRQQHRQISEDNVIVKNAERVLKGKDLVVDGVSVKFIEMTPDNVYRTIIRTIKKEEIKFQNSAIITPQRQKGICSNVMNVYLQHYYNKSGEVIPKFKLINNKVLKFPNDDDGALRIGDKVVQLVNDWKRDIFNGSILTVDEVLEEGIRCKYYKDDNKVGSADFEFRGYHAEQIDNLSLAYAITIHKAQGKGYDNVVIVIHSSMKRMLNKNLLYTAITRAKSKCIIIGDKAGLDECKKEMPLRVTNLFKNQVVRENKIVIDVPKKIIDI